MAKSSKGAGVSTGLSCQKPFKAESEGPSVGEKTQRPTSQPVIGKSK